MSCGAVCPFRVFGITFAAQDAPHNDGGAERAYGDGLEQACRNERAGSGGFVANDYSAAPRNYALRVEDGHVVGEHDPVTLEDGYPEDDRRCWVVLRLDQHTLVV